MRATRPRARARQRLIVGPSSIYAAETTRSSPDQFRFGFDSAFATAERSTFSISRAAARWVNASTVRASGTLRPRMCCATSLALRGDMRTHLATARTSCVSTALIGQPCERFAGPRDAFRPEFSSQTGRVACSLGPLDLRLAVARVAAEHPRRRELAELVADADVPRPL